MQMPMLHDTNELYRLAYFGFIRTRFVFVVFPGYFDLVASAGAFELER